MLILQHNCAGVGQVVEAVCESGVKLGADLILIQEAKRGRDGTVSHPGYRFIGEETQRTRAVVRVGSAVEVEDVSTVAGHQAEGDVQVLDVTMADGEKIRIVNVYDQARSNKKKDYIRPCQLADWTAIKLVEKLIIAGDINAHSQRWNPRCKTKRNHIFWEEMLEDMEIWNSEEPTRLPDDPTSELISIIDITASRGDISIEWAIAGEEHETGSDHQLIVWEVAETEKKQTLMLSTGWDLSGWEPTGCEKEEADRRKKRREEAETEWHRRTQTNPHPPLGTDQEIEDEALWIRQNLVEILDRYAKVKRTCARSKRWWTEELSELRRAVRRARSGRIPAEIRTARRNLRRAIRQAKKTCWNNFVQGASGEDIWKAAQYTKPRRVNTMRPLYDEDGTVAYSRIEKEAMIVRTAFPAAPPMDPDFIPPKADSGKADLLVNRMLVERLLKKCSNQSAPGPDKLSYTIIKMLFQWNAERVCNLIAACIRQGYHPRAWRTAKGVVIPKPGKPDYGKARAHRVISLLDTMGKLVERVAAHLISERLEMNHHLHDGQYGGRVRRSTVDAVAVLINETHQAWKRRAVAGALLMDVRSAFNNVSRSHLASQMNRVGIDPQLIRWSLSFMEDRRMVVEINNKPGSEHQLDSGIPQGSPVSPILFAVYMSELFDYVEQRMDGRIRAISFVDDIAWWTSAKDTTGVQQHLEEAASHALQWARNNAVSFDTEKTEAICYTQRAGDTPRHAISMTSRTQSED